MPDAVSGRPRPKPIEQCQDIYDVLEHARLRPAMFVGKGGSLGDLAQWLGGYQAALRVHRLDERFELDPTGQFTNWLSWNYGTSISIHWFEAVEQLAQDGESAIEAFFWLLDAYRAESTTVAQEAPGV